MPSETPKYSDEQLTSFLEEMLPAEEMADIEQELRDSEALRHRAAAITRRRDQGVHSVGEIWRRSRLSCPTRNQLGSFLLGTLDKKFENYLDFHIRTVGCRICAANLYDLEQALKSQPETKQRRRKFFQSSAGYLPE